MSTIEEGIHLDYEAWDQRTLPPPPHFDLNLTLRCTPPHLLTAPAAPSARQVVLRAPSGFKLRNELHHDALVAGPSVGANRPREDPTLSEAINTTLVPRPAKPSWMAQGSATSSPIPESSATSLPPPSTRMLTYQGLRVYQRAPTSCRRSVQCSRTDVTEVYETSTRVGFGHVTFAYTMVPALV
ncbi:hypothetical protein FOMPIDRAFT_1052497 [Fomitopsis schrenkii]|uniref:Uncharacterized protein n=1 Tax=Fomitopsis schrenkii TaxID=2126942 RepID=S8DVX1_FOMSC|nr:hypothetical protein FOMPIDRAFT_1052497 [Fomitopsis schrenkii]